MAQARSLSVPVSGQGHLADNDTDYYVFSVSSACAATMTIHEGDDGWGGVVDLEALDSSGNILASCESFYMSTPTGSATFECTGASDYYLRVSGAICVYDLTVAIDSQPPGDVDFWANNTSGTFSVMATFETTALDTSVYAYYGWDWGEGDEYDYAPVPSSGVISDTHWYWDDGSFTVTLHLYDADWNEITTVTKPNYITVGDGGSSNTAPEAYSISASTDENE